MRFNPTLIYVIIHALIIAAAITSLKKDKKVPLNDKGLYGLKAKVESVEIFDKFSSGGDFYVTYMTPTTWKICLRVSPHIYGLNSIGDKGVLKYVVYKDQPVFQSFVYQKDFGPLKPREKEEVDPKEVEIMQEIERRASLYK